MRKGARYALVSILPSYSLKARMQLSRLHFFAMTATARVMIDQKRSESQADASWTVCN